MREVRYLPRALNDLRAIARYYREIDPAIADRNRTDIESAIELLDANPHSGRLVGSQVLRHKLTRRYRFKIAHRVRKDAIEILGVFRHQNRTA